MWKRLNRSKDATISAPTGILETTLPDGYLDSIPEVKSPRDSTIESPGLPPLPFHSVPPLQQPNKPFVDRASSVYSEQPEALNRDSTRVPSSIYTDISPPDSPGQQPSKIASSGDVSPVDAVSPSLPISRKSSTAPRSHLPVPRKPTPSSNGPITKFGNSPGWRRETSGERDTRWDEYSGEPTVGDEGRPASVKPSMAQHFAAAREKNKQLFSGLRDRDPAKRKASAERGMKSRDDPSQLPAERPPWHGASGRHAIVNPVRDDPTQRLAPLQIPQNNKGQQATRDPVNTKETSTIRALHADTSDESIKPIVPLKAGANSPHERSFSGPQSPSYVSSPLSNSPAMTPTASRLAFEHADSEHAAWGALPAETEDLSHLKNINLDDEPGSRFSATTMATTVRGSPHSTPRPSFDAPPMPPMPSDSIYQQDSPTSVVRPTWQNNTKATMRKPAPSERTTSMYSTASTRSKSLPQCPPETEARDKVTGLEARMEDLNRRRRNIEKVLKDLTHVINPSSPGYDLKTKAEVRQTVMHLNDELAEIGQEEHATGMKLHRAQRRADKEGEYGGATGLWIKRVTS